MSKDDPVSKACVQVVLVMVAELIGPLTPGIGYHHHNHRLVVAGICLTAVTWGAAVLLVALRLLYLLLTSLWDATVRWHEARRVVAYKARKAKLLGPLKQLCIRVISASPALRAQMTQDHVASCGGPAFTYIIVRDDLSTLVDLCMQAARHHDGAGLAKHAALYSADGPWDDAPPAVPVQRRVMATAVAMKNHHVAIVVDAAADATQSADDDPVS